MRKFLNDHLDKIEKQTVEEMISKEQELQVKLKKVLVAMETKRTDFDNIRQDVKKVVCHPVIYHNLLYRRAPYS
jgi:hypothetical protein